MRYPYKKVFASLNEFQRDRERFMNLPFFSGTVSFSNGHRIYVCGTTSVPPIWCQGLMSLVYQALHPRCVIRQVYQKQNSQDSGRCQGMECLSLQLLHHNAVPNKIGSSLWSASSAKQKKHELLQWIISAFSFSRGVAKVFPRVMLVFPFQIP